MTDDAVSPKAPSSQVQALMTEGDRLRDSGDLERAETSFRNVIALEPTFAEGHYKLAIILDRQGRLEECEAVYRMALRFRSRYPQVLNNLGLLCFRQHRFAEAESCYREALAHVTNFFEAHVNLGNLLAETARRNEALFYFRRAVELRQESAVAHERLGGQLRNSGLVAEALQHLRLSLEIDAASSVAWNNLGACHFTRGEHAAADEAFEKSLSLERNQDPAWANRLMLSNLMSLSREDVFSRHREYGKWIRSRCGSPDTTHPQCSPDPERRLRLGFVSGDLRHHSVAYFLRGFLPCVDRKSFELFAYSNSRLVDDVTTELQPMFHGWRDVFDHDDDELASLIRSDRIDVLIDLAGHTNLNRLPVFARRPAPVQATWIGYPTTTGLDVIDYRITDVLADPEDEGNRFHTETLWRVPSPFLCYSPFANAPDVNDPPSFTSGVVTFGSFNNRAKLGRECIALWSRVLAAVPSSRMVIKCINGVEEEEAREQLRGEFAACGIGAERIDILPSLADTREHLAQYSRIDIALDSFPYHGTTTTCEAMWMGVPVVTLLGDRHASRVGATLLASVGADELVSRSVDEFVAVASALADSPGRLTAYRTSLRQRMAGSPLTDGARMAGLAASVWREMWRRYCQAHPLTPVSAARVSGEGCRLNIGGRQSSAGWKTLDVQPGPGVDLVGDVRRLDGWSDESVDEVYCVHLLQRLPISDVPVALKELFRVLKPGGRLLLSVPDIDVLASFVGRDDMDLAQRFQAMRMIFGEQVTPDQYNLAGLNMDFLLPYLAAAGFQEVEQVESFNLFEDASTAKLADTPVSLNLIVSK